LVSKTRLGWIGADERSVLGRQPGVILGIIRYHRMLNVPGKYIMGFKFTLNVMAHLLGRVGVFQAASIYISSTMKI
jgi:hypothetical protein